jgi:hypothetical protein
MGAAAAGDCVLPHHPHVQLSVPIDTHPRVGVGADQLNELVFSGSSNQWTLQSIVA